MKNELVFTIDGERYSLDDVTFDIGRFIEILINNGYDEINTKINDGQHVIVEYRKKARSNYTEPSIDDGFYINPDVKSAVERLESQVNISFNS